jgi:hypothetical protein
MKRTLGDRRERLPEAAAQKAAARTALRPAMPKPAPRRRLRTPAVSLTRTRP